MTFDYTRWTPTRYTSIETDQRIPMRSYTEARHAAMFDFMRRPWRYEYVYFDKLTRHVELVPLGKDKLPMRSPINGKLLDKNGNPLPSLWAPDLALLSESTGNVMALAEIKPFSEWEQFEEEVMEDGQTTVQKIRNAIQKCQPEARFRRVLYLGIDNRIVFGNGADADIRDEPWVRKVDEIAAELASMNSSWKNTEEVIAKQKEEAGEDDEEY